MATIHFKTKLYRIGSRVILRLPGDQSAKLPSRGQTMVEGTVNGVHIKTPLEPDGKLSHWFEIDKKLQKEMGATAGDTVIAELSPTKDWPEPPVSADLMDAVKAIPQVYDLWQHITPMARWEWVRWLRATNRVETRARRVEVACSKMQSGERRPCCWNRNLCTEPAVSKNGVLLDPGQTGADKQ